MRSLLIVVSTPTLHLFARVRKGQEPMLVQAFRSEATVEGLNEGIAVGFHAELSRFWSEPLGLDHGTQKN